MSFKLAWIPQCLQAFELLNEKPTSAPKLGYADFTLPFILETDASSLGLGPVQHQKQYEKSKLQQYEAIASCIKMGS